MKQIITSNAILQTLNFHMNRYNTQFICIFDLDDTIFDTSYRRFFIYGKFLQKQYHLPALSLYFHRIHYNFISLIENTHNFQENRSDIVETFYNLFLSNSFLHLDKPFPGVKTFLNYLYILRIPVIFLTGRLESAMRGCTCESLRKYNLINPYFNHESLVMKKYAKRADFEFKKRELKRIRGLFPESRLVIFDNESKTCSVFSETYQDAIVVRFNSVQKVNHPYNGLHLNHYSTSRFY